MTDNTDHAARKAFEEWAMNGPNWTRYGVGSERDFSMWKAGREYEAQQRPELGAVREALEAIAGYPDANTISDAHYVARKHAREALSLLTTPPSSGQVKADTIGDSPSEISVVNSAWAIEQAFWDKFYKLGEIPLNDAIRQAIRHATLISQPEPVIGNDSTITVLKQAIDKLQKYKLFEDIDEVLVGHNAVLAAITEELERLGV